MSGLNDTMNDSEVIPKGNVGYLIQCDPTAIPLNLSHLRFVPFRGIPRSCPTGEADHMAPEGL